MGGMESAFLPLTIVNVYGYVGSTVANHSSSSAFCFSYQRSRLSPLHGETLEVLRTRVVAANF